MTILMMGMMAGAAIVITSVIDFISVSDQKASLQGVADRAALAAARELIVATNQNDRVLAVAQSFVDANYKTSPHQTAAEVIEQGRAVKVTVTAQPRTFFPDPFANAMSEAKAESIAEVSGGGNVCMVGLDEASVATLNMMNQARLTAEHCAVYSNSLSSKSLWLHDLARVNAEMICVAGGFQGAEGAFPISQPMEDCPRLEDPLRDRPKPEFSPTHCDYLKKVVPLGKSEILEPGVYCGGLVVMGGKVTLKPGVYVMKQGQLFVGGGGELTGEKVGFFLTGSASTVLFGRFSRVSLTAPKTGDMAGLLFFEDRDTTFQTYHQITSRDARNLVGTMYFPKSKLLIDADNPVADRSDYTIIIAREFELRDGPELVLNTDYAASDIPVPEGVGDKTASSVRLVN